MLFIDICECVCVFSLTQLLTLWLETREQTQTQQTHLQTLTPPPSVSVTVVKLFVYSFLRLCTDWYQTCRASSRMSRSIQIELMAIFTARSCSKVKFFSFFFCPYVLNILRCFSLSFWTGSGTIDAGLRDIVWDIGLYK